MADKKWVKFVRAPYLIDVKVIYESDWARIGIDHPTVQFDRSNKYLVDATDFPEEVLEYFRHDEDFSISTAENPVPPGPAELVARGPFGTDPERQGFADEGEGRNALDESSKSGPTTTVGGSTRTSGKRR